MKRKNNIRIRYREEILSGEIIPLLLKLGLPGALGLFLQNSFNLVDRLFVARLGEEELGAVGIAFIIQSFLMALAGGLSSGLRSHSSRSAGADRLDRIREGAHQGFYLVLAAGVLIPLTGRFLIPYIYRVMAVEQEIYRQAVGYTNIILLGAFFQFFFMYGNSLLRGIGEMLIPVKLLVLSIAVNLILDPLLIFGWGPIPPLAVRGAALATVIARCIAVLFLFRVLIREGLITPSTLFREKLETATFKSIMKVGFPAMFNRSLASISLGFIYALTAPFGAGATAAYTACYTFRRLLLIPSHGFSGGASTMMGVNNGAEKFGRTGRVFLNNAGLSSLVLIPLTLILMIFARPLLSLMLRGEESLKQGVLMLRILAPSYLFIALRTSASGGLNSLGEGGAAMLVTLAHNFFLTLPLGWLLSRYYGLTGLCAGLTGGYILSAFWGSTLFFIYLKNHAKRQASIST